MVDLGIPSAPPPVPRRSAAALGGDRVGACRPGSRRGPAPADRRGGRGVMALGSVIGGLGYLLMAWSHDPITYLAAWVLIGLGMAVTP